MCSRVSGGGAQRTVAARLLQGSGGRGLRGDGGCASGAGRAGATVQSGGRSHPHHVAGFPDLLRRAGDRDWRRSSTSRRMASICTGGGLSSMPARISMRRSTSRKPAPAPRRLPPRRWWCRSPSSMSRPRRRRIPTICSRARILRPGSASTGGCRTIAASPCIPAGHSTWAIQPSITGKDASGVFHFPGVAPEAAEWLMKERKVVGLAVDTCRSTTVRRRISRFIYAWLPSGRWGLENVANLDKVAGRPGRRWWWGWRR